ncbi:hypothetical protein FISHEDRAFT_70889 [Fistulina hepatica ATCC 64428]|uniref:Uncharacterized protein n=1 Tax=Fistulina hepatica ATCC 64428 TaxID=1128425 RepID=A0A0D7AIX2_9AGAR|nr:hypothetical protein FISHEDRAFT_70889 [Fistulina hepatica ATCC 64428]
MNRPELDVPSRYSRRDSSPPEFSPTFSSYTLSSSPLSSSPLPSSPLSSYAEQSYVRVQSSPSSPIGHDGHFFSLATRRSYINEVSGKMRGARSSWMDLDSDRETSLDDIALEEDDLICTERPDAFAPHLGNLYPTSSERSRLPRFSRRKAFYDVQPARTSKSPSPMRFVARPCHLFDDDVFQSARAQQQEPRADYTDGTLWESPRSHHVPRASSSVYGRSYRNHTSGVRTLSCKVKGDEGDCNDCEQQPWNGALADGFRQILEDGVESVDADSVDSLGALASLATHQLDPELDFTFRRGYLYPVSSERDKCYKKLIPVHVAPRPSKAQSPLPPVASARTLSCSSLRPLSASSPLHPDVPSISSQASVFAVPSSPLTAASSTSSVCHESLDIQTNIGDGVIPTSSPDCDVVASLSSNINQDSSSDAVSQSLDEPLLDTIAGGVSDSNGAVDNSEVTDTDPPVTALMPSHGIVIIPDKCRDGNKENLFDMQRDSNRSRGAPFSVQMTAMMDVHNVDKADIPRPPRLVTNVVPSKRSIVSDSEGPARKKPYIENRSASPAPPTLPVSSIPSASSLFSAPPPFTATGDVLDDAPSPLSSVDEDEDEDEAALTHASSTPSLTGSASLDTDLEHVHGRVIQALATGRPSAQTVVDVYRNMIAVDPHLSGLRDADEWQEVIEFVLEEGARSSGVFGKVESSFGGESAVSRRQAKSRVDAGAGKRSKGSATWFYVPDNDSDKERAEILRLVMPEKRRETRKYKQYYFEPLAKIDKWNPEAL